MSDWFEVPIRDKRGLRIKVPTAVKVTIKSGRDDERPIDDGWIYIKFGDQT